MGQENFHASVQYNDFSGSAAADNSDQNTLKNHLSNNGLIGDKELIAGIKLYSGEALGRSGNTVSVTIYIVEVDGYDNLTARVDSGEILPVRDIRLDISPDEFFKFFKRFELAISPKNLIGNKEIYVK